MTDQLEKAPNAQFENINEIDELLKAANKENWSRVVDILKKYESHLHHYFLSRGIPIQDVGQCVLNTYFRALNALKHDRSPPSNSVRGWLVYSHGRSEKGKYLKKRKQASRRHVQFVAEKKHQAAMQVLAPKLQIDQRIDASRMLLKYTTDEERNLLSKFYVEGFSAEELAAAYGVSRVVMYGRLNRTRKRVCKRIRKLQALSATPTRK